MRFWATILSVFLAACIAAADDKPAAKPADDQVEKERATQRKEFKLLPTSRAKRLDAASE